MRGFVQEDDGCDADKANNLQLLCDAFPPRLPKDFTKDGILILPL